MSSDSSNNGSDHGESDYDPAEKLSIKQRRKHYYDLGRRMGPYTELRLKRIISNPDSGNEDYHEAMYQLHTRFPKHKRGR